MKRFYYSFSIILFFLILFIILIFSFLNLSLSSNNEAFIYPTKYTEISSKYGYRELYGNLNFHNGIDFLAPQGSEIYASNSGVIQFAGFMKDGFGNTIVIQHDSGVSTLYCHVSENFIVSVGNYVKKGQLIGYVGPKYLSNGQLNGNTTGPHLHFSVYKNGKTIDPITILEKNRLIVT